MQNFNDLSLLPLYAKMWIFLDHPRIYACGLLPSHTLQHFSASGPLTNFDIATDVLKKTIFCFPSNSFQLWLLIPFWRSAHILSLVSSSSISFSSDSHFVFILSVLSVESSNILLYMCGFYVIDIASLYQWPLTLVDISWGFHSYFLVFMSCNIVSYL